MCKHVADSGVSSKNTSTNCRSIVVNGMVYGQEELATAEDDKLFFYSAFNPNDPVSQYKINTYIGPATQPSMILHKHSLRLHHDCGCHFN